MLARMTVRLSDFTTQQIETIRATDFAAWVQCLHETGGPTLASKRFLERFPRSFNVDIVRKALDDPERVHAWTKAAVAAGSTTDWGAALTAPAELTTAFVAYANRQSLIGRIPGVLRVPFNVPVPVITSGATFAWVGEGRPKVPSALATASATIAPAKTAGTIVVSEELLRTGAPGTADVLRTVMAAGLARFLDLAITHPAIAAVAGLSPASWTNGALAVTGTGDASADVAALMAAYLTQYTPTAPVLLLPMAVAVDLGLHGARDVRVDGVGTVAGIPAVVSPAIAVTVIADVAAIPVADTGDLGVDVVRQATTELASPATEPPSAAVLVSLWQNNLVGIRAERIISWARAVPAAVAYLTPASVTP